jgi:hypothetical protein
MPYNRLALPYAKISAPRQRPDPVRLYWLWTHLRCWLPSKLSVPLFDLQSKEARRVQLLAAFASPPDLTTLPALGRELSALDAFLARWS